MNKKLPQIMNKQTFTEAVLDEVIAIKSKRLKPSYMEAVIAVCENYNIMPEDTGRLIDDSIKAHIEVEAKSLRMIKQENDNATLKDYIK